MIKIKDKRHHREENKSTLYLHSDNGHVFNPSLLPLFIQGVEMFAGAKDHFLDSAGMDRWITDDRQEVSAWQHFSQ